MNREEKYLKRRSWVAKVKAAIVAVILAAIFLLLFHTQTILVEGSQHTAPDEVRTMVADSPVSFNTVLLCAYYHFYPVTDVGFIDSLTVSFEGLQTVKVHVQEKQLAGYVFADGAYWYFDRNGVVQASSASPELTVEENRTYIPFVAGLTVASPEKGDSMPGAETGFYERFGELQTMLNRNRMIPETVTVDESYHVTLTYENVTVLLGDLNYLDARMRTLEDVLPETRGMKGTLHLEGYDGSEEGVVFRKE